MCLSKSIYVKVWSCPKGAWINKYHPEWVPENEDLEARARTGNEVGDLARGLFGESVNVSSEREDGRPDIPAMLARTQEELEKGTAVICEASFSYEGMYCAVDLLKRDSSGWAIYEVKSTTKVEEKHIQDGCLSQKGGT